MCCWLLWILVILLDFFFQQAKLNKIHQHHKSCKFQFVFVKTLKYRHLRDVEKRRNVPPLKVFVSEWDLTVEVPQTWHSAINNHSGLTKNVLQFHAIPFPSRKRHTVSLVLCHHRSCFCSYQHLFLPVSNNCFSPISKKVQDSIWTSRCWKKYTVNVARKHRKTQTWRYVLDLFPHLRNN